jgi:putative DNA primase/helicase
VGRPTIPYSKKWPSSTSQNCTPADEVKNSGLALTRPPDYNSHTTPTMENKNSKTEKSTNSTEDIETDLSPAEVAADITGDENTWFYPEDCLITTHAVRDVSAEEMKRAFERQKLPDGNSLSTLSVLLNKPKPVNDYLDNPEAWSVTSIDETVPWEVIRHVYKKSGAGEARQKVVERLVETSEFAVDPDSDELLLYSDETGIYEQNAEECVRRLLEKKLGQFNSEREADRIIYKLKHHDNILREFASKKSKVCVKNGVLDLSKPKKPKLLPHSSEYHFRSRVSAEFDASADSPRFDQFIAEQVADKDIAKLQEFIGYIVGSPNDVLFDKSLILVGETAAGKSTFLDTITSLLGEENTSHLTLQQMVDSQFALSKAHNVHANICNDLDDSAIQNTGRFKQLVSGDAVEANRKYEDHFSFEMTAKQIYATNKVPSINDPDDAFYRRWLHVRFPESVSEDARDGNLESKLQDELSGILNWALEGYARVIEQGGFTRERSSEEKRDLWQTHGDSIDQFVSSELGMASDSKVPKKKLYEEYTDFCYENGLAVESKKQFTSHLKQEYGITISRPVIDGDRTRCYRGVILHDGPSPFSNTDSGPEVDADTEDTEDTEDTASIHTQPNSSPWSKAEQKTGQDGSQDSDIPDTFEKETDKNKEQDSDLPDAFLN